MRELKPFETIKTVAHGVSGPPPPPPEAAFEIMPIMVITPSRTAGSVRDMRPQSVEEAPAPVAETPVESTVETEGQGSDDAGPKAVTSSATGSASGSESDSSEMEPIHPSSLSGSQDTPASVEKESSQPEQQSSLPTNPGLPELPAWELEPLPTAVISSSPDVEKPAN